MWQDTQLRARSCFLLLVRSHTHSVSVCTTCCVAGTILGHAPEFLPLLNLCTSLSRIDEVICFSDPEPK